MIMMLVLRGKKRKEETTGALGLRAAAACQGEGGDAKA